MTGVAGSDDDFVGLMVGDELLRDECLAVLEQVRRDELRRGGGSSVVDSAAFGGIDAPFELMAVKRRGGGPVLGTIRLTIAADVAGASSAQHEYRLDTMSPSLLECTVILTRLALLPEVRNTTAGLQLYEAAYRRCIERSVELVVLSCEPNLLNLYAALGGRPYGRVRTAASGGFRLPMAFVLHDGDYFRSLGSPFAAIHEELGVDQAGEALTWWQAVANEAVDSGVAGLAGPDVDRCGALTRDLTAAGREQLLRHALVIAPEDGDLVLKQDDGSRFMGVVLDGYVEVRGPHRTLNRLGPSELFGELAFLLDGRRTADVVVAEPGTRVALLSQSCIGRVEQPADIHAVWRNLARVLASRITAD